jgi:hypothetical protein
MLGVAFTVAVMAGGPGCGAVAEPAPPPQADRSARKVKAYGRDIMESNLGKVRCLLPSSLKTRLTPDLFPPCGVISRLKRRNADRRKNEKDPPACRSRRFSFDI